MVLSFITRYWHSSHGIDILDQRPDNKIISGCEADITGRVQQGWIQELITKGGWGVQEYEYNYEGRGGVQEYNVNKVHKAHP